MCMINRAGKLANCSNLLHYYPVVSAQSFQENKIKAKTQGYSVTQYTSETNSNVQNIIVYTRSPIVSPLSSLNSDKDTTLVCKALEAEHAFAWIHDRRSYLYENQS